MIPANCQTKMEKFCMYCGKPDGFKDGLGVTGPTSTICDDCKDKGLTGVSVTERKAIYQEVRV